MRGCEGAEVRGCGGAGCEGVDLTPLSTEVALQACHRTARSSREHNEPVAFAGIDIASVGGVTEVLLTLHEGTTRYVEEVSEVVVRTAPETFCDVPRR